MGKPLEGPNTVHRKTPQLDPYKWKKGQSGNPGGRPKGSRQKLCNSFLDALHEDFQDNGAAAIIKCREKRPHEYLKIIVSLVPKEMHLKVDPLQELTDEQLFSRLMELEQFAAVAGNKYRASEDSGGDQAPN